MKEDDMENESHYDEKISPLMAQIIELCKTHKIGLAAQFCVTDDNGDPLRVSTVLAAAGYSSEPKFKAIADAILAQIDPPLPPPLKITTKRADGTEHVEIIQVIP